MGKGKGLPAQRGKAKATDDPNRAAAYAQRQNLIFFPPPLPFEKEKKDGKKDKVDDKDLYKEIKVKLDPNVDNSETVTRKVKTFEDGTAEEWLIWRREFDDVCCEALITTADMKMSAAVTLLRGKARELFQFHNGERVAEMATQPARARREADATFKLALDDVGQRFFPTTHPLMRQVQYLRSYLVLKDGMKIQAFRDRLVKINGYLRYFPADPPHVSQPEPLPDYEICDIIHRAIPHEWKVDLLTSNFDIFEKTKNDLLVYLQGIEVK